MENRILRALVAAMAGLALSSSPARAEIFVPGDFQDEIGAGGDWSLADAPTMNDLGGGLWDLAISTGVASTRFEYKGVNDPTPETPPAWSDGEIPDNGAGSPNSWLLTDGAGNATLMLDRNVYDDGFLPNTDRFTVSTDITEFVGFSATGDWVSEAGGSDIAMTNTSGNLWEADAVIATPGTYFYHAIGDAGAGASSDYQFFTNGRLTGAGSGDGFEFNTFAANQEVTFLLDLDKGAISFSTETFLDGDTDGDGIIELEDDFGPIRDNWLVETFLRAEGNLDNEGASEGVVDVADFRQWKVACADAGCATAAEINAAFNALGVPEPTTVMLTVMAGAGLLVRRRRCS